jgi:hypothetical protein
LIDWFCATNPMQLLRIERDLKLRMQKQGLACLIAALV